jgi:hypothetical protein
MDNYLLKSGSHGPPVASWWSESRIEIFRNHLKPISPKISVQAEERKKREQLQVLREAHGLLVFAYFQTRWDIFCEALREEPLGFAMSCVCWIFLLGFKVGDPNPSPRQMLFCTANQLRFPCAELSIWGMKHSSRSESKRGAGLGPWPMALAGRHWAHWAFPLVN